MRKSRPLSGTGDAGEAARARARPKAAVKWNVLPAPSVLSTQIRPPISSTSCLEMVSPRPVSPGHRPVGLGKRIENGFSFVRGDPDAGVPDREVQSDRAVLLDLNRRPDHD